MGLTVLWRRAALLAGASSLLIAGAAQAQGAPAKDEAAQLSLGKIVVSAGAEKVAIDTPQAVTALDQDDIDQVQATTMGDLLEAIPGVSAVGGVSALGQGFNIRGLGTGLADSDSRILMQVDGVAKFFEQYRMGSFFSEPELYKRVEVLRGPASSTLYGAGALAGVVNFTTKDAADFLVGDDTFALRLRGGYETNSGGKFGSAIAAGKVGDLDLLAMVNARNADHYKSGDGKAVIPSNASASSYLLKGKYYIGGEKGHTVWASYQNWLSDSTQVYDQAEAFGTTPVRRKVDDITGVLGYENDFGGSKVLDLKAQVSYADSAVEQRETTFLPGLVYSEFSYRTWQGRLENTSRFTWGDDWAGFMFVGVQASRQERRNPRTNAAGTTAPGGPTHPEGDMDKYGVFAQAELIWSDKLTLIPGVRVDKTKLTPGGGIGAVAKPVADSAASPKLAAMYAFNDHVSVFGSVAHTVRMPVLDEIYSRTNAAATNVSLNLKPEESDNIEGGFTLSFDHVAAQGDAVRIKTTAFRNDVANLITRGTPSSSYFINVGRSRFKGVEVEAEYASRWVFARAGLSHIEGENRVTGLPLNTIPADELDLTLGYNFRDLGVSAGWRGEFAAEQDEVTTATLRTGGYGVHNLFLTWKPRVGALAGLDMRLAVDNLFDKQFRRHLNALDAEGRTFKVALARSF